MANELENIEDLSLKSHVDELDDPKEDFRVVPVTAQGGGDAPSPGSVSSENPHQVVPHVPEPPETAPLPEQKTEATGLNTQDQLPEESAAAAGRSNHAESSQSEPKADLERPHQTVSATQAEAKPEQDTSSVRPSAAAGPSNNEESSENAHPKPGHEYPHQTASATPVDAQPEQDTELQVSSLTEKSSSTGTLCRGQEAEVMASIGLGLLSRSSPLTDLSPSKIPSDEALQQPHSDSDSESWVTTEGEQSRRSSTSSEKSSSDTSSEKSSSDKSSSEESSSHSDQSSAEESSSFESSSGSWKTTSSDSDKSLSDTSSLDNNSSENSPSDKSFSATSSSAKSAPARSSVKSSSTSTDNSSSDTNSSATSSSDRSSSATSSSDKSSSVTSSSDKRSSEKSSPDSSSDTNSCESDIDSLLDYKHQVDAAIDELEAFGQRIFPLLQDAEHVISTLHAVAQVLVRRAQAGPQQAAFSQLLFLWITRIFIPIMDENIKCQSQSFALGKVYPLTVARTMLWITLYKAVDFEDLAGPLDDVATELWSLEDYNAEVFLMRHSEDRQRDERSYQPHVCSAESNMGADGQMAEATEEAKEAQADASKDTKSTTVDANDTKATTSDANDTKSATFDVTDVGRPTTDASGGKGALNALQVQQAARVTLPVVDHEDDSPSTHSTQEQTAEQCSTTEEVLTQSDQAVSHTQASSDSGIGEVTDQISPSTSTTPSPDNVLSEDGASKNDQAVPEDSTGSEKAASESEPRRSVGITSLVGEMWDVLDGAMTCTHCRLSPVLLRYLDSPAFTSAMPASHNVQLCRLLLEQCRNSLDALQEAAEEHLTELNSKVHAWAVQYESRSNQMVVSTPKDNALQETEPLPLEQTASEDIQDVAMVDVGPSLKATDSLEEEKCESQTTNTAGNMYKDQPSTNQEDAAKDTPEAEPEAVAAATAAAAAATTAAASLEGGVDRMTQSPVPSLDLLDPSESLGERMQYALLIELMQSFWESLRK